MNHLNNKLNKFHTQIVLSNQVNEQSYLDKMKNIYKNQGFKILLKQIMKKMLSPIFITNSAIWFEMDLTKEFVDYKPNLSVDFVINPLDQTIEWLKNQKESWVVHPKEITTAQKHTHYWPTVRINGNIIGCIKIGFDDVFIVDYNKVVAFPDKIAFIYDTFIIEEKRGKGIGKYLLLQAVKFLKSKGYKKVRCHIPSWNKISISVYEKIGFKKINYIRFYRVFGITIRKISPVDKIPRD